MPLSKLPQPHNILSYHLLKLFNPCAIPLSAMPSTNLCNRLQNPFNEELSQQMVLARLIVSKGLTESVSGNILVGL